MRQCVSAHRHLQNGIVGVHSSRSQTVEVKGVKKGLRRGLIHLPVWLNPSNLLFFTSIKSAHIT